MSLLEKKLSKSWADEVIKEENRLISAIIYDLQEMGKAIAAEIDVKEYGSIDDFFNDHTHGKSPFDILEGKSDREDNLLLLKQCPMTSLLNSVMVDGKLPSFYQKVVDKFKEIHKTKGAILHPFCIVHQVIRATVGEHVKINGRTLKVYQVACRSMTSGKIVYATEGTSRVEMEQDDINKKIDGKACMYLLRI